jgi:hypothetical protein
VTNYFFEIDFPDGEDDLRKEVAVLEINDEISVLSDDFKHRASQRLKEKLTEERPEQAGIN